MKACPNCHLPEDQMDECTRKAFGPQFTCPEPVEVDPDKSVHVKCATCVKDLVLPLGKMLHAGTGFGCQRSSFSCHARVVPFEGETPPPPAPTLAEEQPKPASAKRTPAKK